MQYLPSSAARQSRNPPTSNLGRSRFSHTLTYVSPILAIAFLISAAIIIAHNTVDSRQRPANMQIVSNKSTPTDSGVQSTQTPSIKSIGTDPPPASDETIVSINGQDVPIPPQGSSSQTIVSGDTQTNVDVTHSSSSTQNSSEARTSESLNINISNSSSSTDSSSDY